MALDNPYFNAQNAQDAMAGFGAGMANSQPKGQFTINPYAGYQASHQGLAQGGAIGAIIGGVTAQVGQFSEINKNLRNLQTGIDGTTYDAYGRPVYQGGNVTQGLNNLEELNKGEEALSGAKSWVDPANKAFSWGFGTKKRIRAKRSALQKGIAKSQSDYNTADVNYRQQMNQLEDYNQRMNSNSRMYNLFRSQY